jgi:hypothetical protein
MAGTLRARLAFWLRRSLPEASSLADSIAVAVLAMSFKHKLDDSCQNALRAYLGELSLLHRSFVLTKAMIEGRLT